MCTRSASSSAKRCAIRAATSCSNSSRGTVSRRFSGAKVMWHAGHRDLERRTQGRSPSVATDLTRAFSIWFLAVNTAEKVHRIRRRREYLDDATKTQPGGIADCIARLHRDGLSLDKALELVSSMSIEPVFAAHPTESTRRTILRKQQHIAQNLFERLNPVAHTYGNRNVVGTGAPRDHEHMANRRPSQGRAHRRRRAGARVVLLDRDPVPRHPAVLRRSRVSARQRVLGGRGIARRAQYFAFRILGRRRHGWQRRRAWQDHSRDAASPSAIDRIDVFRGMRPARGNIEPERKPGRNRCSPRAPHRCHTRACCPGPRN